ncbi:MAG: adenosylcobinamide-GDP ribazoletransferase, partial [Methanomassiliicoccales archaeon]
GRLPDRESDVQDIHRAPGGKRIGALRALFSLFTLLPVRSGERDLEALWERPYLLPLIGAVFGLTMMGVLYPLSLILPLLVAAPCALFAVHLLNRFLHFDALLDLGDGLVAHGDREMKVRAMRDSGVGAGAMAFGLFFTLVTVASLSSLTDHALILLPFGVEILSRVSMVACAGRGDPREGLGRMIVSRTRFRAVIPSIALSLVLLSPLLLMTQAWGVSSILQVIVGFSVLVMVSVIIGVGMASLSQRSFGAVSGDVMGATNEISRLVLLVTGTVVMDWMVSMPW